MSSTNDIILPKELAEYQLSLEEIGAIFVMFSMPKLSGQLKSEWSDNERLNLIIQNMLDIGFVTITSNDELEPTIEIDITKLKRYN